MGYSPNGLKWLRSCSSDTRHDVKTSSHSARAWGKRRKSVGSDCHLTVGKSLPILSLSPSLPLSLSLPPSLSLSSSLYLSVFLSLCLSLPLSLSLSLSLSHTHTHTLSLSLSVVCTCTQGTRNLLLFASRPAPHQPYPVFLAHCLFSHQSPCLCFCPFPPLLLAVVLAAACAPGA